LQGTPKFTQSWIFVLRINHHLATLAMALLALFVFVNARPMVLLLTIYFNEIFLLLPTWVHRNLSTRRRMLKKKWANFFQLVSNLLCVVKRGFIEPCKNVPL
jgi:hypothetical protein